MKRVGTYSVSILLILFMTVSGSGLQIYLNTCLTCGTKTVVLDEEVTCSISFQKDAEGQQVAPICCKRDKISPELNLNIIPAENISLSAVDTRPVKTAYSINIEDDSDDRILRYSSRPDLIPRSKFLSYLVRTNKITFDDDNTLS